MSNQISRQYELDFRDRGRAGLRIQSSVKNFQLTLEVCISFHDSSVTSENYFELLNESLYKIKYNTQNYM